MRRLLLLFLLSLIIVSVKAQNHGTVKAIVLDSLTKQPIPFATVSILKLKDTALVSYTVTDKNGAFTLYNVHEDDSRLLISHVGYQSFRSNLDFKNNKTIDLGKLYLTVKILQEVIVKGERVPVLIKKDTIEFDAEAFKTRPNALVEDLLRKLPGVQVDHDGVVTINGKELSKIKIDGKDFFVGDPKLATKNLEANMIAKVQVYDDREDDPDHLVPDYDVKKIINLKFKKAFKMSSFGTGNAAAGTEDRYSGKLFFSKFHDDLQIGVNASSDNLSRTDAFGSGQQTNPQFNRGASSIMRNDNANISFNNKWGKTLKLNGFYSYNNGIVDNQTTTQRQQFIADTTFKTNSMNKQQNGGSYQAVNFRLEWDPDTINSIKYSPQFSYSNNNTKSTGNSFSSNNFVPLINTNVSNNHGNGNSVNFQHDFRYYRKLNKDGASFSLTNVISIRPNNNNSYSANDLISYIAAIPSDTLRRLSKTTNHDVSGNVSASIHYPFTKKFSADVSFSGLHDRNGGDLFTYDQDFKTGLYTILLTDQSSNLIRDEWQQTANPLLTYKFTDKISFKAGFAAQFQQIGNHFNSYSNDLNQHFSYILPSAELHVDKLTLSYGNDVRQPSISDLQPVTIVYTPLYTFIGNPNLKPTRLHNFMLNYFNYQSQEQTFINAFARATVETNSVLRERTVNADGAEITSPINRNGRFTASINGSAGKTFKKINKWLIRTSTSIGGNFNHNFFEVNQQEGYQNTTSVNLNQEFTANYNDVLDIVSSYQVNYALTKYQQVDFAGTNYTTQAANLAVYVFLPEKYTWGTNYSYKYNPLVAQGFQRNSNILSLSLARKIQDKDKGEIRISCYDLLNQAVSAYHYASENTITDTQNQVLKRYFLLSYSYRFNDIKAGSKK
jgi:hypothetical protein